MPKPDITPGDPCWIDLMTSDPEKAKDFYTGLFGWTYETGDAEKYGGYIMAFKNGAPVAGMMKNEGDSGYPDAWTTYLRVEDINAAADAAADPGGQIFLPPMEVPDQGHMAMLGDTGGAAVGFLPEGVPSNWQVYFAVENADATIETAQSLGGRVIQAAEDTPFGRMATLTDPTGSILKISQPIPQGN